MNAGEHATATPISVWRGKPRPLGSSWDGGGVNFALYSENAEARRTVPVRPQGRREVARIDIRERTNFVWHCYLPEARPGLLYGYRVHGPYAPERGDRFNAHKLLLDPYARLMSGPLRWTDAHYGYRVGSRREDLSRSIARQRVGDAQMPGDRLRVHLGQRHTAADAVGRHPHLRIARQGLHPAASCDPAAASRDLCRPVDRAGDRASATRWASPRSS